MLPPRPSSRPVPVTAADLVEVPSARPPSVPPPLPPRRSANDASVRVLEHELLRELDQQPDALAAARVCLDALELVVPSRAALVHAFDEVRNDFIVVHARGEAAAAMVLVRSSIDDPLLRIAMPRGEIFPWNDLRRAPVQKLGRFADLAHVNSVVSCPIISDRRWLGAIELVDTVEGTLHTRHVLAARYVAGRYARFLSSRGVVVDVAAIARFASRAAAAPSKTASGCRIQAPSPDDVSRRARSTAGTARGDRAASA